MEQPVYTEEYKGHIIKVYYDEDACNPREEFDNLATMVCFHSRYNLGDKHSYKNDGDLVKQIEAEHGRIVWLPLYLYDHSGITMSTGDFGDRWDSGCVGLIFISVKDVLNEYGGKRLTAKKREQAIKLMESEVKEYDDYIRGNVYGYVIEDPKDGVDDHKGIEDSCWGFYGDYEEYMIPEARASIDWHVKKTETLPLAIEV